MKGSEAKKQRPHERVYTAAALNIWATWVSSNIWATWVSSNLWATWVSYNIWAVWVNYNIWALWVNYNIWALFQEYIFHYFFFNYLIHNLSIECDSCGKIFLMLVIWEDISKLFMKVTKISNVNLVQSHLLKMVV